MNFSIIRLSSENENPKNENTEHRLEPRTTEDDGDGQLDLPIYLRSMQVQYPANNL